MLDLRKSLAVLLLVGASGVAGAAWVSASAGAGAR